MNSPFKTAPSSAILPSPAANVALQCDPTVRHLLVKIDGRRVPVPIEAIDWCDACGNYVELHVESRVFKIRRTMAQMSALLGPFRFARISRTTIVNLERIREIESIGAGGYVARLHGGSSRRLTRAFRNDFMERFFVL